MSVSKQKALDEKVANMAKAKESNFLKRLSQQTVVKRTKQLNSNLSTQLNMSTLVNGNLLKNTMIQDLMPEIIKQTRPRRLPKTIAASPPAKVAA